MSKLSIDQLRKLLAPLQPLELQIEDESAQHAGHPGARGGGGHYRLRLVSPRFLGLTRLQRHRLVYDCLDSLMPGQIHALAMTLLSPEEAASAGSHPPSRE
jgi:BolA family transcriptional regulator, general stress-responsive regulator